MEAKREEGFVCPLHYFDGKHFVSKDCELDENGNCAFCGQVFDEEGSPKELPDQTEACEIDEKDISEKKKILLDQTGGYLYEKLSFCPRDIV